jgi:hypothetical protein
MLMCRPVSRACRESETGWSSALIAHEFQLVPKINGNIQH